MNKYKTITLNKFDTFLVDKISIKLLKRECNATQRGRYMRHFLQFFLFLFILGKWKIHVRKRQISHIIRLLILVLLDKGKAY